MILDHDSGLPNRAVSPRYTLFATLFLLATGALFGQAVIQAGAGPPAAGGATKGGGNSAAGNSANGANQGSGTPSGSTGTAYFETQMLAYGAVNQLSSSIAAEVCKIPQGSTVILFDQASFQNLQMWQSFQAGAALLAGAYNTLYQRSETPTQQDQKLQDQIQSFSQGPSWAGATEFGALSGLVTALSASTANNASTFTIQDSTLAVSIAHQLKRCPSAPALVYYPLFGSYVDAAGSSHRVHDTMEKLNSVRAAVQQQVLARDRQTSIGSVAVLQDLNQQYDQLFTSLLVPTAQVAGATAGTAPVGITSLIQGADLEYRLQQPNTFILYADVVAAGGTQIDRKNLLTVLFTGDWISYSGGLIANVALTKSSDNSLIFSDTLRYRTARWLPFATVSHPIIRPNVEMTNSGDNLSSICNQDGGPPCAPASLLNPSGTTVAGGAAAVVSVDLAVPAPANETIALSSSNPGLLTVPAAIPVPQGQTHAEIAISAGPVAVVTTAQIQATLGGVTRTIPITVVPLLSSVGVELPISLQAASASSPTFKPGDTIQLYADLSRPATPGGIVVGLSTINGAFASMPANLIVEEGQTRGTASVPILSLTGAGNATVAMTLGGVIKRVTIVNVGQ